MTRAWQVWAGISMALWLVGSADRARAEGTETLGEAHVALAAGTGVVQAGVGLEAGQPAALTFAVPADAAIVQVLLYWSHETAQAPDPVLDVDGVPVAGTQIGGPAYFFDFRGQAVASIAYRADITDLGLVTPGANSLEIAGLDTQVSTPGTGAHGAGVLVIIDDGGPLAEIQVVDGVDVAYCGFSGTRGETVPQTLVFTPQRELHAGTLHTFAGSINESLDPRGTEIRLDWSTGESESLFDVIDGVGQGDLFDATVIDLAIPADASGLTFSIQSANEAGTCPSSSPRNASITWIAAALVVPLPDEAVCGDGIVDPGEQCDDGDRCGWNGCRNDCTIPRCGDGLRDRGERCDDGNLDNGDGCSDRCRIERVRPRCPALHPHLARHPWLVHLHHKLCRHLHARHAPHFRPWHRAFRPGPWRHAPRGWNGDG